MTQLAQQATITRSRGQRVRALTEISALVIGLLVAVALLWEIAKVKSVVGWPTTQASVREAMRHVPNSLVQDVCACGTVTQALDKIGEYVTAGITEASLTPMGSDKEHTLRALAPYASLD